MRDICRNRHRDNSESNSANARVNPAKADMRYRIMRFFYERGDRGATCEQAAIALALRYTTASARISELKAEGLLAFTGEHAKTSGGASAALLKVATEKRAEPEQLELIGRE